MLVIGSSGPLWRSGANGVIGTTLAVGDLWFLPLLAGFTVDSIDQFARAGIRENRSPTLLESMKDPCTSRTRFDILGNGHRQVSTKVGDKGGGLFHRGLDGGRSVVTMQSLFPKNQDVKLAMIEARTTSFFSAEPLSPPRSAANRTQAGRAGGDRKRWSADLSAAGAWHSIARPKATSSAALAGPG